MHMPCLRTKCQTKCIHILSTKEFLISAKRGMPNLEKNIIKQVNINGHISDVNVTNEFDVYFKQVFHSTHDNAVYTVQRLSV